ncbi:MAG TPA: PEGA domain-containing protein [Planctomycetota bacterium]|jgi:hypothetical protein
MIQPQSKIQNLESKILPCLAVLGLLCATGCTSRGITVTSIPAGAEVSINRRVVGHTPIRVGFTHYGTYRIELRMEKYQVMVREENVRPPVYGYDPAALFADNLVPARLNDEVYLHYVMKPLQEVAESQGASERESLMQRAELARSGNVTHPFSGKQYEIAIKREPVKQVAAADDPLIAPKDDLTTKPDYIKPIVGDFTTPQPEGMRIAKQLELVENRAGFKDPDADKKPDPNRAVRTPRDEELIYERPAAPLAETAKKAEKPEAKKQ